MSTSIQNLLAKGRIHVLQVIGHAIVGRTENYVMRLIKGLARERFVVTALCPDWSALAGRLRALGVDVVIIPMPDDLAWSPSSWSVRWSSLRALASCPRICRMRACWPASSATWTSGRC